MKVGVVGSGIAGLASAWLLRESCDVTLFEADGRLGGHSNTVDVTVDGHGFPVDTGFLVCNERTYPNLMALFEQLGVELVASDMSFAVSLESPDIEWSGTSLATVFAQKRNLLRPGFWRMLTDLLRFNRETLGDLPDVALGDYLREQRYGAEFTDWYLLPMAAAIWSAPTATIRRYPLQTFVRFCRNHGLLQLADRPQWLTVRGGSREYVRRIAVSLPDVRLGADVVSVTPVASGGVDVRWRDKDGALRSECFDRVVIATHSNQALALRECTLDPLERAVLGGVGYQPNRAVLHTDRRLLPRDQRTWSAWNYLGRGPAAGDGHRPVSVSYLINRLQPLPVETPVMVTLNASVEPDDACVLAEFDYAHPVFDAAAIAAQARLPELQGHRGIWYCGAWTRYGFHEDGLRSALAVAADFGVVPPWRSEREAVAAA